MPRNVNLIYYSDGGCTRRPAGLDGSAGQPRWVQPSLTPPTGRDPLGSRLSVVGRERDEDGGAAEAGVLMRGWRSYASNRVVIDCAMTQIGPVLRIGIQSSNRIMKKCEPVRSWHWVTIQCDISFRRSRKACSFPYRNRKISIGTRTFMASCRDRMLD